MKVSIFGAGYVGLVSAACFTHIGHQVICYDVDEEKIKKLTQQKNVLFEPDLDKILASALKNGLAFTSDLQEAISFCNTYMVCVGTPATANGMADLSYLFSAIENLSIHAKESFIVITKSTVPVGTANQVKSKIDAILNKCGKNISVRVVSCPEFLAQGSAVQNFLNPDRIVIGTDDDFAFNVVKELYAPITVPKNVPSIQMSSSSAELTKYASNLFLATKISFMNEISRIAELTGADIIDVIHGTVADARIGRSMSNPGCGFGGSCLSKDLKALIYQVEEQSYCPALLRSVLDVNENQKKYFISKVFSLCENDVKNKIIAICGLAFKPNTDDIRDSISCYLIEALIKAGAKIQAYDPVAGAHVTEKFQHEGHITICQSKEQAIQDAELLVVLTEWPEFYHLDFNLIKNSMKKQIIIDGRNIYDPKELTQHGIFYYAIGKALLH